MPPGGHGMGFGPGSRNFMSEEEKKNLPQVTPELLKRVFSYLTPYWKQLALTLLCIVFSSIMSLMPSVLTGKIIDEGLIGRDFNKLIMYIVLSLAVTAGANRAIRCTAICRACPSASLRPTTRAISSRA